MPDEPTPPEPMKPMSTEGQSSARQPPPPVPRPPTGQASWNSGRQMPPPPTQLPPTQPPVAEQPAYLPGMSPAAQPPSANRLAWVPLVGSSLIVSTALVAAVVLWPRDPDPVPPTLPATTATVPTTNSSTPQPPSTTLVAPTTARTPPVPTPTPAPTPSPPNTPAATSPPLPTPYAERDELYEETVAVVWSEKGTAGDVSLDDLVRSRLEAFRSDYDGAFVAFNGNDFASIRDNTVGVAFRGSFSSAADGAQWCRDIGLETEDHACFGLRLSDSFGPENSDRGVNTRWYPVDFD